MADFLKIPVEMGVPNPIFDYVGTGSPVSALANAAPGSMYRQKDGASGSVIWQRTATAWESLGTSAWNQAAADALYVKLVGSTMTGPLAITIASTTYGQGNKAYIDLQASSGGGNAVRWGHSNPDYIHTIGTYHSAGYPYIAFHAYQSTGDAFNRLGGSTIPFHLRYLSTTGYLEYWWSSAGTVNTGITWTRKFYFGSNGDLGIEGSLYFTAGTMRMFDDGTYLNVNGTHPFYINSNVPVTYIYSPDIYLGNTSGTGLHVRQNVLYFGADTSLLYSVEAGPVTYGTFRMQGARNGYSGFYFDEWAYYVMNHASIYGLYSPSYGWRFMFSGSATTGSWDLTNVSNIYPDRDVYINQSALGYGLVGVYDSTKLQAVFAMSNAYRMNPNGTVTSYNFYGLAWTYDASGGGINTGYSLFHGLAIYAASVLRSYVGMAGIYTVGLVRADTYISAGTYVQSGTYVAAGTYFLMNPTQIFYFDGGGDTYMQEVSANLIRFVTGGAQRLTIGQGSYFGNYSDNTSSGGMVLYTSGSAIKGYVYWDAGGNGLLSDTGNWGVRVFPGGGASPGGSLFGAWSSTGNVSAPDFVLT